MLPIFRRLNAHRLEHDLSFPDLAAEMRKAECRIGTRTLHTLLTKDDQKPRDRTLYKIQKFLNGLKLKPAKRKRSRRPVSVGANA